MCSWRTLAAWDFDEALTEEWHQRDVHDRRRMAALPGTSIACIRCSQ